ncbi:hypothetical protein TNCV_5075391 [Trichonephila clavipes]|uniref:Uncharacterized protein n=1 Tax=Trichonephila clavipes TaxID=2585209 RepID=A0A8X6V1I2_TRICX|nr:hypothetical protein TNCV_5075391 [Trichonephila clavipes]
MIVQFRNEKDSNRGSIPITIDCNVVDFIVFEEGFHQPIKRTKQSVFLETSPNTSSLVIGLQLEVELIPENNSTSVREILDQMLMELLQTHLEVYSSEKQLAHWPQRHQLPFFDTPVNNHCRH